MKRKDSAIKVTAAFGITFLKTILLFLILTCSFAYAIPPLPTEFYGMIRDYNNNASPGQVIRAYDSLGTLCGSFTIVNGGFYGSMTCKGDDPETPDSEGTSPGDVISFTYRGAFTTPDGNTSWETGTFKYVNLTYPVVFCGDNFCDAWHETYYTCPEDCPDPNATINITTNATMNLTNITGNITPGGGATGQGTGTGGAGGTGGASGGGSRPPRTTSMKAYASNISFNMTGEGTEGYECQENWTCTNWTKCSIDGIQTRTCTDQKKCGTTETKPPEEQKCLYQPTCNDGRMNGLEEGIDCGGLCPPCIGCYDGIQNCHDGSCEQDIDCGGPCPPCATCFDKIMNCHDGSCELGIDCGGPCEKRCPATQAPKPIFVCKKEFNPFGKDTIVFFLILLSVIVANIVHSERKVRRIKNNKSLKDVERVKLVISTRRKMYLFTLIIILISAILYLYYYFFIMCETDYKFLWMLLLLLIAIPIIIHETIRYLAYDENKKIQKYEEMLYNHKKQVEGLIKIENENICEFEKSASHDLEVILTNPAYLQSKEQTDMFSDLKWLCDALALRYSTGLLAAEDEKNHLILIQKVLEDENCKAILNKDQVTSGLKNKLQVLAEQYMEKSKLMDELKKINESAKDLKTPGESENTNPLEKKDTSDIKIQQKKEENESA